MKILQVILIYFVVVTSLYGQSENIFWKRDFWKTNPTPTIIDAKIKEGNSPSQANPFNFDAVVYAILENASNESIKHLMSKEGNDVNKLTHDGRTYIFWAAYKGNDQLMSYLLKNGAKTDIIDDHGFTILNFAANASVKNTKVYDLCLAHGADLKKDLGYFDANALLMAIVKDDDLSITKYFVSKGLDIASTDKYGNDAFNYAAKSGNIELLNQLLNKGLAGNDNAFLFAAYGTRGKKNRLKVYQYLESKGLNPNVINEVDGSTPLHQVAWGKDEEVINYFISKGVDVNAKNKVGVTAFMNASQSNNLNILKLLFKHVKDINQTNKKGQTALMLAVKSNTPEMIKFLLDNGGNAKQLDKKGHNISHYLLEGYSQKNAKDFPQKMTLLKTAGVDIKLPQKNGKTWYHYAVEKNNIDLMRLASKMNQDINAKDNEGNTALLLAAMKAKDDEILKFLLKQGADKTITTDFEESAFDLAKENELLKKHKVSLEFLK
ncbi:ankyrin repeat domain-containing protein [Seonamhaeicola marinus]|uniref:Ankyrin repeat domain-containing protein n=1 Tax=Seonamhaeicola marinus TaxID=1912246 RepID=A0A5D0HSQ9_9FLAO|nr:ankyrin repeat domain-containing protein [Seonamhaeicola marinus]TYA74354.1 ankyrin repeat domain-containing protein [Seonamhaeicola marinus]